MVTSVLIPGCLVVFKDSISVSESLWYVCTVYHLLIILSRVSVDQAHVSTTYAEMVNISSILR